MIAAAAAGEQALPPNVHYWYLHSRMSSAYKARGYPKLINEAPRIYYAGAEHIALANGSTVLSSENPLEGVK